MKILELFGGIGACSKALERLNIDYEITDYVEIDKYAVASFNSMHGTNFEPQDICEWDKDIEVDLVMHGSPCQDFSLAGKQAGGDKNSGTRSSLMYETIRIVDKLKPKYVIWENVKNLLSKKHRHNFDAYLETMKQLGYKNYYQVLNAKDYGIPQNRERVFTISILNNITAATNNFEFPTKEKLKTTMHDLLEENVEDKYYLSEKMIKYISSAGTNNFKNSNSKINLDIARPLTRTMASVHRAGTDNFVSEDFPKNYDLKHFEFPPKKELKLKLKDMLEDEVDEKYYLSNEMIKNIICEDIKKNDELRPQVLAGIGEKNSNNNTQWYQQNRIYNDNVAISVTTSFNPYYKVKNATKKGYLEAYPGDGVYTNTSTKRGTVQPQSIQTLTSFQDKGVVMNDLRIRKLTPKECWRLMGFDDEDFEKASQVCSNSQLYKQAGNSIVVNVLEAILRNLLLEEQVETKGQMTIFDFNVSDSKKEF